MTTHNSILISTHELKNGLGLLIPYENITTIGARHYIFTSRAKKVDSFYCKMEQF